MSNKRTINERRRAHEQAKWDHAEAMIIQGHFERALKVLHEHGIEELERQAHGKEHCACRECYRCIARNLADRYRIGEHYVEAMKD